MSEVAPPIAVYRRTVRASLERVWENVLDWEHLPWLHRTSFEAIRLHETGADGWRATITLPGRGAEREALIEVRLDRPKLRYTTRTLEGIGGGTEIVTGLLPEAPRATAITVDFNVPGVAPEAADSLGAGYVALYTRLWDEDEAMMIRRQAILDAGIEDAKKGETFATEPLPLGPVTALRRALPAVVELRGREYRIVEIGGRLVSHATVCPHRGGPLGEAPVVDGCVTCPWHGYRYDVVSGRAAGGHRHELDPAPIVLVKRDQAFLAWPDGSRPEENR